jgi:hypothetical protein
MLCDLAITVRDLALIDLEQLNRLCEREQVLFAIVPDQGMDELFFRSLAPTLPQARQLGRITLSSEDRFNDP